ncbi:hypothetical protein [Thalassiella azotivora]
MRELVVPARFNGPPSSGNGGWTAGALAGLVADAGDGAVPVSVRLLAPPPLDVPLRVGVVDDVTRLTGPDGAAVAEASAAPDADLVDVARVPDAEAAAAASAYRGAQQHPFPTCFVCGPDRPLGDGLHLTPGVLADRPDDTACTWEPREAPDVATTWSALDCPGGWSVDLVGRPMVLGTMTAQVLRTPDAGERCVVMGRALGSSGRTARTATTLWSSQEVLARATAVWVAVSPEVLAGLQR